MNCPYILFLLFWSFVGAVREPPLQMSLPTTNNTAAPKAVGAIHELPLQWAQMSSPATMADTNYQPNQPVFKNVPPQVFIFKPGAGPYDSVAYEFTELIAFMADKKMPGQLAAVFYDDPAKVPAESLRWEVGVITSQPPLSTEPYTQKIISGRKAASFLVDGLPGQNHERYATMLGFIRQRRHLFKPPAMEILLQPATERADPKTEILLPVQPKRREK